MKTYVAQLKPNQPKIIEQVVMACEHEDCLVLCVHMSKVQPPTGLLHSSGKETTVRFGNECVTFDELSFEPIVCIQHEGKLAYVTLFAKETDSEVVWIKGRNS